MREGPDSRCTTTATVRGTRLRISGVSRFLCLSFFAAAKKVSAAPHRGNANRPLTQQGKAKEPDQQGTRRTGKKKINLSTHPQTPPPEPPTPESPRQPEATKAPVTHRHA